MRLSWILYLLLGLATNAAMWGLAFFYIKATPAVYISNWTLSLPGTVTNTRLNLPNSGTASSEAVSPYANTAQDPRENYKFIATSKQVQKAAATQLNIPEEKFGQPRIKIVNNTTLITFELSGRTPEEAQKKSFAFYKAFQARLNELRTEEVAQREAKMQGPISDAQKKLALAQKRLSDYQVGSGLSSATQIEQLSNTIEELRKRRVEVGAQQQQSSASLRQLSTNLDVSAPQASDAFILKADQQLQQYLKEYNASTAALVLLNSKYLPDNPAVVREQSKLDSVKAAIVARSRSLLGRPVNEATLAQLNIGGSDQSGTPRETLFKDLVTSQVEQQGLKANVQELDQQIAQLEARLKTLARSGSTLESLRRDLQLAEAVFSSTLASSDLGKSKLLGSYPEVQLLAEPSLPDSPTSPKKKLILLGAALGSLLTDSGIALLLLYKHRQIKLSKKIMNGTKELAKYETSEF
jgi:uncharacterized protein involved in exopolysaccharide biosynthesis